MLQALMCLLGRFLVVYSKPFIVFVILLIDLGFPFCLDFYNFTLCLLWTAGFVDVHQSQCTIICCQ